MITLEQCLARDRADELASLRQQFDLPEGTLYLDGNSLGALPKDAPARAQDVIRREWGADLINSWNRNDWWALPTRLGDRLAPLIGAGAGEAIVTDTTSLNLFKVVANAVDIQRRAHPERKIILAERDAFPTDLYVIQGLIGLLDRGYTLRLIDRPEDLDAAVTGQTAVVVLSHVNYRTGYLYDMRAVDELVHARGALAVWDLCHSIGAVPIDLKGADADFAIGCTYKYLNGGPGAPAMLWAHPRHRADFRQPLSGWWGHARPFDMAVDYVPDPGIRSFLCGTQPIVSMSLVACGVDIFLQTGMEKIRRKSLALTDLFIELVEQECAGQGLALETPLDHAHRGSHVSFRHPQGYAVVQALIARGVIGDYREPEVMRFGITPLYLRFVDVWEAVQHLKAVLARREWERDEFRERGLVT
ncbi:kynureninase [Castellaniella defragrans]|uniref:Kynureninase n=1 Tax=Castellaniella defragrans TaxID=75697 RepID=A0A7W9WNE3_CASDE|nr:kynureninase [Castellaniella defragrans]KAB0622129.1 kynureninase [Castellaniella defragrans]MBB6085327.1 kynureninase [Castellaniella defragrans]